MEKVTTPRVPKDREVKSFATKDRYKGKKKEPNYAQILHIIQHNSHKV